MPLTGIGAAMLGVAVFFWGLGRAAQEEAHSADVFRHDDITDELERRRTMFFLLSALCAAVGAGCFLANCLTATIAES